MSESDHSWVQQWWLDQRDSGRLIQLEYPVLPRLRRANDLPINERLGKVFDGRKDAYKSTISKFEKYKEYFDRIPRLMEGPAKPYWENSWVPVLDGMSLYAYVVENNPQTYMEIGSGVSTTFVRQAIVDHGLRTKIISIDPYPRSEIDEICDQVIRQPLEDCDLAIFDILEDGDVLFCDNSHRGFQNTDVTVFFTEVMPRIEGKDVLVGIHDIFLPFDYPEDWLGRHYNEQYYMIYPVMYENWTVELPCFYCVVDKELNAQIEHAFDASKRSEYTHRPAIIWVRQK